MSDEQRDPKGREQRAARNLTRPTQEQQGARNKQAAPDVETMMRDAAPRSVPNTLMQGIMARIADPQTLPQQQPRKSTWALALGTGVAAALLLPLLVAVSLVILVAFGTGTALSGAALGVLGLVVLLYASLTGLIGGVEQLIVALPWLFALLILIPLAWFGLWRLGKSWSGAGLDEQ